MRDLDESASGGLTQAFAHIPGGPDPRRGWGLSPPYFWLSNSGIIVFVCNPRAKEGIASVVPADGGNLLLFMGMACGDEARPTALPTGQALALQHRIQNETKVAPMSPPLMFTGD